MSHSHSPVSAPATNGHDLAARIAELLTQIDTVKAEYATLDKRANEVAGQLAQRFPVYDELYMSAATEYNRAQADLARTKQADTEPDIPLDDAEKASTPNQAVRSELSGSTHNAPISVNKLYRRIAQLAHPDKTDDSNKHTLFLEAKEAKKQGVLSELIRILALLTGDETRPEQLSQHQGQDALAEKLSRINVLRKELTLYRSQLMQLRNSPMARIVDLISTNTTLSITKAETLYKMTILQRVKELETNTSGIRQDIAFQSNMNKT
ncbi:hypothetical protein [Pseudoalteromonas umbrosa]|uniref:hypothetical protein n=1 Tax=Pseudoalteromonas umbrosa TaxID=3048489 RepID=UPI0024C458CB|nr:hypothetical protein [Pseudoalteromonas sp. B95]MDK1290117.1 hypothetical protein [Pseudoalteromonas sp. B95]